MLPSVHGTSFHMGFIFDVCVFPCYFPTDPVSYAEVLLKLKSQTPQFKVSLLVHGTIFHMGFIFGVCFSLLFPHRPSVLCGGPAEAEVAAPAGAGQPGEPAGWRACQAAGAVAGAAGGRRRRQAE